MKTFLLLCRDKPGALDLRKATRSDHLHYVSEAKNIGIEVLIAGPILNEDDAPAGSLFILNAASKNDVERFNQSDPYTKAGLFGEVEIRPYAIVTGALAPE